MKLNYTKNKLKAQNSPKFAGNTKKLELAMLIRKLRSFSADDIAQAFGTTRQAINYRYKQEAQNEK